MKAGSVYYHFDSKDQILDEVLNTGIERLQCNVEIALKHIGCSASTEERLRAATRAHVVSFLDEANDAHTFLRVYEHLPPIMKRRNPSASHQHW